MKPLSLVLIEQLFHFMGPSTTYKMALDEDQYHLLKVDIITHFKNPEFAIFGDKIEFQKDGMTLTFTEKKENTNKEKSTWDLLAESLKKEGVNFKPLQ